MFFAKLLVAAEDSTSVCPAVRTSCPFYGGTRKKSDVLTARSQALCCFSGVRMSGLKCASQCDRCERWGRPPRQPVTTSRRGWSHGPRRQNNNKERFNTAHATVCDILGYNNVCAMCVPKVWQKIAAEKVLQKFYRAFLTIFQFRMNVTHYMVA
jgi:hypothetical protein